MCWVRQPSIFRCSFGKKKKEKKGQTHKLTSLSSPYICSICKFVIYGSKNRARLTQCTHKQTAQSESLVNLHVPKGEIHSNHSIAWNADFNGRHMNATWCNHKNSAPFSPIQPHCVWVHARHRSAKTGWVHHYKNNSFSNYKAATWGLNVLIIIVRVREMHVVRVKLETRFKQSQVLNRNTTGLFVWYYLLILEQRCQNGNGVSSVRKGK